MNIKPGKVIQSTLPNCNHWNFTVILNGAEKVVTTTFERASTAKLAMRSFIDGAKFILNNLN